MRKIAFLGLAAAFVAVPFTVAAAPAAPAPAVQAAARPGNPAFEEYRATLRKELLQSGGGMMRWAMTEYPGEFRTFEDAFIADVMAGRLTIPQAQQRVFEFVTPLRTRGQGFLHTAPDRELVAFMHEQLEFMRYLKTVNMNACYEMGEDGGLTLPTLVSLGDAAASRMSAYADKQVLTVIKGQKTPVSRRQPLGEKELGVLMQKYVERGGEMAWLQALSTRTFTNVTAEDRCSNALILFETILAEPDDVAVRFLFAN